MMNYMTVENPTWNKEGSMIDCIVDFVGLGKIPFSASPTDLPHSVEIYNRCVAGDFGPIADYVFKIDEGDNPQSTGPLPDNMRIPVTNTGVIPSNPNEVL